MTTQTSPDASAGAFAIDDMLCEVARQWLDRRGWQGVCELVRESTRENPEGSSKWLGMPAWTFDLGEINGESLSLRFHFPKGSVPELAETALMQSYLRAAMWMSIQQHEASLPPRGQWVLAQRADVEKQLHDLGNRMNSLLANTGVLATVHRDDERLGRFAQQAAREGDACARELSRLSRLLLEART